MFASRRRAPTTDIAVPARLGYGAGQLDGGEIAREGALIGLLVYRAGPLCLAILGLAPMLLAVPLLNRRRRWWRWPAFMGSVLLGLLIIVYAYTLTQSPGPV